MAKTASKSKSKKRTPKAKKVVVEQQVIMATDGLGNVISRPAVEMSPPREVEAKYDNDGFWDKLEAPDGLSSDLQKFDTDYSNQAKTVTEDKTEYVWKDPVAEPITKKMKWAMIGIVVVALVIVVLINI